MAVVSHACVASCLRDASGSSGFVGMTREETWLMGTGSPEAGSVNISVPVVSDCVSAPLLPCTFNGLTGSESSAASSSASFNFELFFFFFDFLLDATESLAATSSDLALLTVVKILMLEREREEQLKQILIVTVVSYKYLFKRLSF
jgi:hypothetical protein